MIDLLSGYKKWDVIRPPSLWRATGIRHLLIAET
jgi:hypothetical protein